MVAGVYLIKKQMRKNSRDDDLRRRRYSTRRVYGHGTPI
jgi:hypothetical protein